MKCSAIQALLMVREQWITLDIDMSAAEFWELRMTTGLEEHVASGEQQIYTELEFEKGVDADGNEIVRRVAKLEFTKNPVPKPLRRFLQDPDFSFQNRNVWHRALHDAAHPLRFSVLLPVLNDKIRIEVCTQLILDLPEHLRTHASRSLTVPSSVRAQGGEWCEHVSSTECRLHCWTKVSVVNMGPLNSTIERTTLKEVLDSSKLFPQRVSTSPSPRPSSHANALL